MGHSQRLSMRNIHVDQYIGSFLIKIYNTKRGLLHGGLLEIITRLEVFFCRFMPSLAVLVVKSRLAQGTHLMNTSKG